MRWQQGLRWLIAVAGVSFAVFLYVRFDRKPPVAPPPVPAALPQGASYQSKMGAAGRQCRFDNGKEVSCVSFTSFTQFTDGRRVIESPKFEGDRGGKPFVVTADRGELKAASANAEPNEIPNETHLIGHVVMREQDGMEITTDDAMYTESTSTLVVPGPLAFHRDRLTGSGVGATYGRNQQLLRINDQAKVLLAADATGHGKLDGQSTSMELNRELHSLVLTGKAVVGRDEETITSDVATMHLTDNEQGLAVMQMRGHSGIVPLPAATSTPEMHADDIDLEFHPDGRTISRAALNRQASLALAGAQGRQQVTGDQLDAQLAPDGHTVKALTGASAAPGVVLITLPETKDTPRRVIRGRTLNASGTAKDGLTSAVFQDAVEFSELHPAGRGQSAAGAVDRHIRSRTLTLSLNGGDMSNIKDARFRGVKDDAVRFENGATTGHADDVTYLAAASKLVLRPGPPAGRSEVDAERINVKARNIDIDLDKTAIAADGDVQTSTKPDKTSQSRGLFDETKTVSGSSASLTYDDTTHLAAYQGGARLWQGAGKDLTRIQADKISVDDTAGDLAADGKVVTFLPMDNVSAGGDPPKAVAARLRYKDAEHRATYTGTTKELAEFSGPDGTVKGVTIDLTLSAEGRDLVTMIADGSVAARVSIEQTARGEHLNYDVKASRYVLDGMPAKVIQKKLENNVESCSQTLALKMSFTKGDNGRAKDVTIGTTGTGNRTSQLATCQDWVIK